MRVDNAPARPASNLRGQPHVPVRVAAAASLLSAAAIHRRMQTLGSAAHAAHHQRFFRTAPGEYAEGDRFLGIRVPVVRRLAREYGGLPIDAVARLPRSPWHEERQLALFILVRQYAKGTPAQREAIYRLYRGSTRFINNWDLVDGSAEHIVGVHLHGGEQSELLRLAQSANLWERRIAVLATFYYIKRLEFEPTLTIARRLRDDPHDLIHKAVGWMLRDIGSRDRKAEERFLDAHAARMPRTMLRYALEKFPPALRRKYLAARHARR
jgi:3-methyladenine DNA glycosylase AlkD